jgi:hypothetical protein
MIRRPVQSLAVLSLAMLSLFCGSDRKRLVPVKGRVLFNGKPVPHALVVFHPLQDAGPHTIRPRGKVAEDGTFQLTTFDPHDGAPPGEYGVTVEWWLTQASKNSPEGSDLPPANRLPARYSRVATSGLRATITDGVCELQPFQLSR